MLDPDLDRHQAVPLKGIRNTTGLRTSLRWGILGCARIARWQVVPAFRKVRLGTIRAISARDVGIARSTARDLRIPVVHESYRALLDDPEIDAIYIPLTNELHHQWTLEAIDAGKHVLCEKPFAMNAEQAREMAGRGQARGVIVREAFMWRHQPRTAEVLRLVRERAIGELRLIRASFSFPLGDDPWRLDPDRGGGALSDVGCYGVNAARLFAGSEPVEVRSLAKVGKTGVDLSITAELRFEGGILALIDASYEQPLRNAYELVGSRGTIEVPDAFVSPKRPIAFLKVDGRRRKIRFRGTNPYAIMFDDFAREVADRSPSLAEDGVKQMAALDAIREACRTA
ncbi:Gfo/Idh/MocA family protein [Tundrisphaera lichenicola]|uniref:Gfo/Idh/MocA family protein n=1 Tax=Tundrisphaera lichenicola TaxID=2029860 RepID=UPI003EBC09B1